MRILVVCQRYWPEQFQVTDICEELAARGHEVTVLAGLPNVGIPGAKAGHVLEEYRHGKNRDQAHNGVRIHRTFEIGRRTGVFFRMLNYYSFWKSGKHELMKLGNGFDAVFAYQLSPAMMAIPATAYGRRTGTPVLLYCCDLWPESLKAWLGNHGKLVIAHFGRICRRMYQAADCIAIESPAFATYFTGYHEIPAQKLVYIPQFSADAREKACPLKPHQGINLLFMGNMGRIQGIDTILKAMTLLEGMQGLTLHFVGDGSYANEAKRYVDENGLSSRVVFHGRQPESKLDEFYSLADICVLAFDGSSLIGSAIPSKLQGYMAAGRPVVAAAAGGTKEVINEAKCGFVVEPGDATTMAKAIGWLAYDAETRRIYGTNARRYFESHFTKKQVVDAIEHELQKLARGRNA